MESVTPRGLQEILLSCQLSKHLESINAVPYLSGHYWTEFSVDFKMGESLGLGKKPQNRYWDLILVSVADTETRFRSYTTRYPNLMTHLKRLFLRKFVWRDFFREGVFWRDFFWREFFREDFFWRYLFWKDFFEEIYFEGVCFEKISFEEIYFEGVCFEKIYFGEISSVLGFAI